MPQILSVLVHYTAVCINLYNDLCTILNGCIIVQLFSAAGNLVTFSFALCSVLGHLLALRSLFVWTKVMIHRDTEAICNILYGLSEESLLLCFTPPPPRDIFFCIVHESHCIPASIIVPLVCVSVLCKVRYTREVKTTVMQVVN